MALSPIAHVEDYIRHLHYNDILISEIVCSPPELSPHIKLQQLPQDAYKYGENISIYCIDNFYLVSGDIVLTCGDRKQWIGVKPTCKGNRPAYLFKTHHLCHVTMKLSLVSVRILGKKQYQR